MCLFHRLPDGKYIYLLLYKDDILIASKSKSAINKLTSQLSSDFEIKDRREAKMALGMEIDRDRKNEKVSLA